MTQILRSQKWLSEYSKKYPDAWKNIAAVRDRDLSRHPERQLPQWCYCSLQVTRDALHYQLEELPEVQAAMDLSALTALASWRMTKGFYRFDPTTFDAVWNTPLEGDIPVDVLYQLPEWCLYIETLRDGLPLSFPCKDRPSMQLSGFFVMLQPRNMQGRDTLDFIMDVEQCGQEHLSPVPIPLVKGTLVEVVQENIKKICHKHQFLKEYSDEDIEKSVGELGTRMLSLVLYICSSSAEMRDAVGKLGKPSNPQPQRIKGSDKLFAAVAPTTWEVGYRMGAAIRGAMADEKESRGSHERERRNAVRPHLRKAHWHTFLTGPRSEKRIPKIKWLPPIPVNLDDYEQLLAVVHPVK